MGYLPSHICVVGFKGQESFRVTGGWEMTVPATPPGYRYSSCPHHYKLQQQNQVIESQQIQPHPGPRETLNALLGGVFVSASNRNWRRSARLRCPLRAQNSIPRCNLKSQYLRPRLSLRLLRSRHRVVGTLCSSVVIEKAYTRHRRDRL